MRSVSCQEEMRIHICPEWHSSGGTKLSTNWLWQCRLLYDGHWWMNWFKWKCGELETNKKKPNKNAEQLEHANAFDMGPFGASHCHANQFRIGSDTELNHGFAEFRTNFLFLCNTTFYVLFWETKLPFIFAVSIERHFGPISILK